ncbi:MAG: Rieske (2Fe-2S) protein [Candidatus Rokuibacteriota bacterium]
MADVRAASLGDVASDRPTLVELDGVRVVLARVGDRVYGLGDTCAHRGGPLGEGKLSGTRLACPWHGWIYDVRTGQCAFPGRGEAVASYGVRVDGDDVWVRLPDASEGQR